MKDTKVRGVAFDMDGLLLNTEDLYEHVGAELLRRRGKTYREVVRRQMIGLPAQKAFGVLIEHEGLADTWQELQRETDTIFLEILDKDLALMPGVEALLSHVDRLGLPRCVATSSTRTFATKALGMVGILERLDFVITAEDVPNGKPHPDIYQAAAVRMGIATQEMLVLEDSELGTRAGVAADAIVISVTNRHTQHGSFVGALDIVTSLEDARVFKRLQ